METLINITYLDHSRKKEIELFLEKWNNQSDLFTIKTSGSTGAPKEINIKKKYMLIHASKTLKFLSIKENDRAYLCLSTETIAGVMMMVRAIQQKMQIFVGPISSNSLDNINFNIDLVAIVPLQMQHFIQNKSISHKHFKNIIIGGASISNMLLEKLQGISINVFQSFGMTETISHIALRRISPIKESHYNTLPGVNISKTKEDKLIVDFEEIDIHQLKTNDIVEIYSPTSFEWIGRADFVINSGGKKFYPEKIEQKIAELITNPFFIFHEDDEILGQKIVLYIENQEISLSEIKKILDKHECPKKIYHLSKFEYTQSAKIDKLATIKKYLSES